MKDPEEVRAKDAGTRDVLPGSLRSWRPEPFRAPWWGRNPHVQTVGGKILRPEPRPGLTREVWETPDGDELLLDFTPEPPSVGPGHRAPTALVLHGLEGNTRRRYALVLYRELLRRGVRAVGLNFRGCVRPNRVARAYHSGETGDLRFVLGRLRRRTAGAPLGAAGFSLGGNVLLKLLAEEREEGSAWLDGAAAISVPYDLEAGARALEVSLPGRRYGRYFLDSLRAKVEAKRALLEEHVDVDAALAASTVREFDERVTAPLHGFRDAEHYYEESSSGTRLGDVRVPTLLVHARDDPLVPWDRVPSEQVRSNPWLVPAFTSRGGHVGFLAGPPWRPRLWAEATAADFLATALEAARSASAPRPRAPDSIG